MRRSRLKEQDVACGGRRGMGEEEEEEERGRGGRGRRGRGKGGVEIRK